MDQRSNKYSGRPFVLNLKKVHNFLNQCLNFRDSKPNSLYNLLWGVSLMAPVIAMTALYWILSIFYVRWGLVNDLYIVIRKWHARVLLSFWMTPIPFHCLRHPLSWYEDWRLGPYLNTFLNVSANQHRQLVHY